MKTMTKWLGGINLYTVMFSFLLTLANPVLASTYTAPMWAAKTHMDATHAPVDSERPVVKNEVLVLPANAIPVSSTDTIKLGLLDQLEKDGYLSHKLAMEAKNKYVILNPSPDMPQKANPQNAGTVNLAHKDVDTSWSDYLSWTNFIKVVAIILFLIAFSGIIKHFFISIIHLIVLVPVLVYQGVFLATTLTLTFYPSLIWASQSYYLALFGSFGNIMVLAWILEMNPPLANLLKKFTIGLPAATVASLWGMMYFGALALYYHSQIFGFFAVVCLSGIFSFGLYYKSHVLHLHFHEKGLDAVVFGHLIVLLAYTILKVGGHLPMEAAYFQKGLEYYATLGLGTGLLIGASPWASDKHSPFAYIVIFVALFAASSFGYFMFDLHVMGSIISVFFTLLVLEWLAYFSYSSGLIPGCLIMGTSLYTLSIVLEKHHEFFFNFYTSFHG